MRGDPHSTPWCLKDETGKRHGALLIIGRENGRWKCQCDCGRIVLMEGNVLRIQRHCGMQHGKEIRYALVKERPRPMAKCPHGIYIPLGDSIALYCSACNPAGMNGGATPVLPGSGDPLQRLVESRDYCPECGAPRLASQQTCLACGCIYEAVEERRQQRAANVRVPGTCPACGSTIHFDEGNGKWVCADCDTQYNAPRRAMR